jgi:hypothetical protein
LSLCTKNTIPSESQQLIATAPAAIVALQRCVRVVAILLLLLLPGLAAL